MSDSRQLEREAEETRSRLERTLDELRDRISPGQLVDQAVDFARESGGGHLVHNLAQQAAENPLSVCLIGAGLAWLALGNGRTRAKGNGWLRQMAEGARGAAWETARERTGEAMQDASARIGSWAADTREPAGALTRSGADRLEEKAHSMSDHLHERARTAEDQVSGAASSIGSAARTGFETARARSSAAAEALSGTASATASSAAALGQNALNASSSLVRRCADQPLVLAGLGVAIGAAIGAALPDTEAENRLMGSASGKLKDQVTGFAQQQYEKGKSLAKEAVRDTVQEASDRVRSGLGNGDAERSDGSSVSQERASGTPGGESQPS